MALYYVTGVSGVGKSTVLKELRRRMYEAYGIDEDGFAGFYNKNTGDKLTEYLSAEERTIDWRRYHEWKLPKESVNIIRHQANDKIAFLCGVTANDREFWDEFAMVFFLNAPPSVIKHRLQSRTGNNYGKNDHELAEAVNWAEYAEDQYRKLGAIIIDNSRPVEKVVDDILEHVNE